MSFWSQLMSAVIISCTPVGAYAFSIIPCWMDIQVMSPTLYVPQETSEAYLSVVGCEATDWTLYVVRPHYVEDFLWLTTLQQLQPMLQNPNIEILSDYSKLPKDTKMITLDISLSFNELFILFESEWISSDVMSDLHSLTRDNFQQRPTKWLELSQQLVPYFLRSPYVLHGNKDSFIKDLLLL